MAKKIIPIAATIIGGSIGGPPGAAIGSAVGTKVTGGSWGDAVKSGVGSYAGNMLGSALGGTKTFGDVFGSTAGGVTQNAVMSSSLPNLALSSAGNYLSGLPVGATVGSYIGSQIGQKPQSQFGGSGVAKEKAFKPQRAGEIELPGSFGSIANLSGDQQTSNIASQGVYGGGLGKQEQDYFLNQINRQLVDESGKVGDMSAISPIESSYLSQLGLDGYTNPSDLLKAISKRSQQAA
jgi:hypothetical protein